MTAFVHTHFPNPMNENSYPFALSHHEFRYEFVSTSQEKEVRKVVLITQTENPGIFNLALLDLLENGMLSDLSQPDNKDFRKALATVYRIMLDFTNKNRGAILAFQGSDLRRHRLYQIVLNRELFNLSQSWRVYGGINKKVYLFEPDIDYTIFFMQRQ
ncbi:DUF6934 family protein [Dyadobacter sandarakinus]|uniref:Uncharacterized protein n=1 Tax=Dyadobacter sandarakinus TaxID=2747268 RepID=A0ABX7I6U5_9BACT|nr:hypothetical protein [Dyadobacter sandarakinus]QRR01819.1 hypothetical protein HWI92_13325 [Dyadobacter sandarakinus]